MSAAIATHPLHPLRALRALRHLPLSLHLNRPANIRCADSLDDDRRVLSNQITERCTVPSISAAAFSLALTGLSSLETHIDVGAAVRIGTSAFAPGHTLSENATTVATIGTFATSGILAMTIATAITLETFVTADVPAVATNTSVFADTTTITAPPLAIATSAAATLPVSTVHPNSTNAATTAPYVAVNGKSQACIDRIPKTHMNMERMITPRMTYPWSGTTLQPNRATSTAYVASVPAR